MALTIHYATTLDDLIRGLGAALDAEAPGPFTRPLLVVPSRAMHRVLAQRLSHHLHVPGAPGRSAGITAGIDYRIAGHLVELGLPTADNPWEPARAAWDILALVDGGGGQRWAQPLRAHLGVEAGRARQFQGYAVSRRIAGLLERYASQRPGMLRAWGRGESTDGVGPLAADHAWQMGLYQELCTIYGELPPPLRVTEAAAALGAGGSLHIFGRRSFSRADLEFLEEVSPLADVHVWIEVPSLRLVDPGGSGGSELLEALGAHARVTVERLLEIPGRRTVHVPGVAERPGPARGTILGELHNSVREDRAPAALNGPDDTLQIHSAHGPTRQVEVLREVLTGLFEDDPELDPRDVIVLCPDITVYAPLIQAAFAPESGHPGAHLRVRVSGLDRDLTNPLFDLALILVSLAGGRVRSTDILDLLHRGEVAQRLGIGHGEVERITQWVKGSGIRWGFDAADRERFGVPTGQNSIEEGLERLLLGVVVAAEDAAEDDAAEDLLSAGDIGTTEIDLLGTFAEFLARLREGLGALGSAATLREWTEGIHRLVAAIASVEEWHEVEFTRALAGAAHRGCTWVMAADVRAMLEEIARAPGSSVDPGAGALTVTSLGAAPAVSYKVVCLVGMDDGAFPRPVRVDGDDALARRPVAGEHEGRLEDRQVFLDALMSARERVIITFSGAGESRGEELHPAGSVAQVADLVEQMTGGRAAAITSHPLHPFDHRYFDGTLGRSFDERSARAARHQGLRRPRPPFLQGVQGAEPEPEVTTTDLHAFFADPVKHLIQQRLGVRPVEQADPLPSAIPIHLDHLEKWGVGARMLRRSRAGGWAQVDPQLERRHGDLPPGALGEELLAEIHQVVEQIRQEARNYAEGSASAIDVDLMAGDARVRGRVPDIHGDTLMRVTYSTLKHKHMFPAWLDLVLLSASGQQTIRRAVMIGRHSSEAAVRALAAPDPDTARATLLELVDLYHRGRRDVLPLPPATSAAWAQAFGAAADASPAKRRGEAEAAAVREWQTNTEDRLEEDRGRFQMLAWGGVIPFAELHGFPAAQDERWTDDPSRFAQFSLRMWKRMFDHEI